MEERIMYVIQRADGKFYWEHQSSLECCGCCGYGSFDKAHLFSTEKGAKSRIGYGSDGHGCEVKRVKVVLDDKEEINTHFGNFTVWNY